MTEEIPEASYEIVPRGIIRDVCFTRAMYKSRHIPKASMINTYNVYAIKCDEDPSHLFFIVSFLKIKKTSSSSCKMIILMICLFLYFYSKDSVFLFVNFLYRAFPP